tara:strand:+ start:1676 stop:2353 length:678 start_codon:yes stop_codon:yes gene_type:complete
LNIKKDNNKPEKTPYEILGIDEGANFEDIQKARDLKVNEAGDDLIAKAKIESSYDQLLMGSLKARQLGSVSFDAKNASIKEKQNNQLLNNKISFISKILNSNKNSENNQKKFTLPDFSSNYFENGATKISLALVFMVLLFVTPDLYNRLLLSLSTLTLTYVQIKSGKRFISALGWSVTFLSIGMIFGGLIETNTFIQELSNSSISTQKIQSIPAMLILWIGIIFL